MIVNRGHYLPVLTGIPSAHRCGLMRITVVTRLGAPVELSAQPHDTIGAIKVVACGGKPQSVLILDGELLISEHRTLAECGAQEGATLWEKPRSMFWFVPRRHIHLDWFNARSAFHDAVEHGRRDVLQVLLQRWPEGALVGDKQGITPFHLAASDTRCEILAMLLTYCPKGAKGLAGVRLLPLHLAAGRDQSEAVTLLMQYYSEGAMQGDLHGTTPFHLAAKNGNHRVVEILLRYCPLGAQQKDGDGKRPIDIAQSDSVIGLLMPYY